MTDTFEAEVLDIREESRIGGVQQWQMLLTRTAFSPAAATGGLLAIARSGATLEVSVVGVVIDGEDLWHKVDKPLAIGTLITGHVAPVTGHVATPAIRAATRTG